jgi:hypothetical protein
MLAPRDQPGAHSGPMPPSNSMGGLASLEAGPEDEEWSGVASAMYDDGDDDEVLSLRSIPPFPARLFLFLSTSCP